VKPRNERQWDELNAIAAVHFADHQRRVMHHWWEFEPNVFGPPEKEIEWWRHWRLHVIDMWVGTPRHTTYRLSKNQHGLLFLPPGKARRCRGFKSLEDS
jgi:hypothetical protein